MATVVIAGIGKGGGTGAAVARLFSKQLGYRVALIARGAKELESLAQEIRNAGGEASFLEDRWGNCSVANPALYMS
jgi:NADP-dependent 3-hydroxy acid dehydrogenase YdfG